jgi:hypothetical protein
VDVVGFLKWRYRLRVAFSDGSSGEHDFSDLVAHTGPMVVPLRDPAFFARVFVPAWPNGFDIDAINCTWTWKPPASCRATPPSKAPHTAVRSTPNTRSEDGCS